MDELGNIPLPQSEVAPPPTWPTATIAQNTNNNATTSNSTTPNFATIQDYPWMATAFGMTPPPPPSGYPTPPFPPSLYNPYATTPWQQQNQPYPNPRWNTQQSPYPQQQWNQNGQNYGKNPNATPRRQNQQRTTNFKPFKMELKPLSTNFVPSQATGSASFSADSGINYASAPESVRRYIERARMAIETRDVSKLNEYLKKRLGPLISSGAVRMINWDNEPLPHTVNFEIKTSWTPASQLRSSVTGNTPEKSSGHQKRPFNHKSSSPEPSMAKVRKTKKQKKAERASKGKNDQEHSMVGQKSKKWDIAVSDAKKSERALRFAEKSKKLMAPSPIENHLKLRHLLIRGTCQTVEKSFFRLTAAPDPSQVRPIDVLEKALELAKAKYRNKVDYAYISSQLRSIRQDLTVQRIRNAFSIKVYEINARICLENKDREEFNQCQNQLKALYADVEGTLNEGEFIAYRLLYFVYMENSNDILTLLKESKRSHCEHECMSYALKVREAWSRGIYTRLFKLYDQAPRMCGYLMDMFIERERKTFLSNVLKAHRTAIPAETLARWFGFKKILELREWLSTMEIELLANEGLDCKLYANKKID